MRSTSVGLGHVALATLIVGCGVVGCGDGAPGLKADGAVALTTRLAPGVQMMEASYSVSGNGIKPISGRLELGDPAGTILVLITQIPAGSRYLGSLQGTAADGTHCDGQANFDVLDGKTTAVGILLACRKQNGSGVIQIEGIVGMCPWLTAFTASPLTTSANGLVTVSATAMNPTSMPAAFHWTATGGKFADPGAATTFYTCTPGAQTLTVTVTSGTSCSDHADIPVTCNPG
jgi:hypothetical protein